MVHPLLAPRWSPFAVGVGIGVLSWITFFFMDKAIGTSTSMVNVAGVLESAVAKQHVEANPYLAKQVVANPPVDWQMALVLLLAPGAFLAARLGRTRRPEFPPPTWQANFGASRAKRAAFAFLGGAILLFGARLAGGCTSGHGISGGLQLAVSSWIFLAAMFPAGMAAAFLLYRRRAAPAAAGGDDA